MLVEILDYCKQMLLQSKGGSTSGMKCEVLTNPKRTSRMPKKLIQKIQSAVSARSK